MEMLSKEEEAQLVANSILNGDDTPIQKNNNASIVHSILNGEDSPKDCILSLSPLIHNEESIGHCEVMIIDKETGVNQNETCKLDSQPQKKRIPLRRKRLRVLKEEEQQYNDYEKFKNQNHSLYLSASNVAAMIGLHPYNILPKLCMDLVYQGQMGQALLRHDAQLLQISIVDEVESMRQIAVKGGKDVKKALEQAIGIGKGKENVSSVQNASKIKENIVSKVKESKTLSRGEIQLLVDGMRHNVNTGFGKAHEENALDLYEKQCGWEVTERNAERRTWKFIRSEDMYTAESKRKQNGPRSKTVVPFDEVVIKQNEEQKEIKKGADVSSSPKQTSTGTTVMSTSSPTIDGFKPFFSINGMIDGIRDELYHVPSVTNFKDGSRITFHELHPQHMDLKYSDDDEWALRKVVVECKHRMNKVFDPPPIYDQIQAVIYAFMYDTSEAELVQVVRNGSPTETKDSDTKSDKTKDEKQPCDNPSSPKENKSKSSSIQITSSRISLDDPVMKHRENWHNTVLPRLRSFVDAVYTIRKDDDKRYRMLRAAAMASSGGDDSEWWCLLHDECPFLTHCDTAFSRKQRRYK